MKLPLATLGLWTGAVVLTLLFVGGDAIPSCLALNCPRVILTPDYRPFALGWLAGMLAILAVPQDDRRRQVVLATALLLLLGAMVIGLMHRTPRA